MLYTIYFFTDIPFHFLFLLFILADLPNWFVGNFRVRAECILTIYTTDL